ncbi:hypothetical protein HID58_014718 [Brassica napus]|uniref:HAT C-terminal dimerisation domain-containing protein n=1 Tax=Brassica napus TaxID=3708 RepID=A0ABQ8DI26_BRANA|nr:hypothetical protein HID58_014718 [Brassica napus]
MIFKEYILIWLPCRTLATPFPPLKLVAVRSVALPATSNERCFSSNSLLPDSLTASTLAGKRTVLHLSSKRTTSF